NVVGSGATTLYEITLDPSELQGNFTTLLVHSHGTCVAPTKRHFDVRVNDGYLAGGTSAESHKEQYMVDVKFSIRKFSDRISVKCFLIEYGLNQTLIGKTTINNPNQSVKLR